MLYYAAFVPELSMQAVRLCHQLHVWYVHGLAFSVIDVLLLANTKVRLPLDLSLASSMLPVPTALLSAPPSPPDYPTPCLPISSPTPRPPHLLIHPLPRHLLNPSSSQSRHRFALRPIPRSSLRASTAGTSPIATFYAPTPICRSVSARRPPRSSSSSMIVALSVVRL